MTVRIGKIRFHNWESLELPGGYSDTFIFRISPRDGLPPADYGRLIRSLASPLFKLRRHASLWVQVWPEPDYEMGAVHGKGKNRKAGGPRGEMRWFTQEVRHALRGLPLPAAVTPKALRPQIWDFSFFPWVDRQPPSRPPAAEPNIGTERLRPSALDCLRVLARADCAYTAEVASLADLSQVTVCKIMPGLENRGYVQRVEVGKYPFWRLRRAGLSTVLRSWGLPPGQAFVRRKERGRCACQEREVSISKKRRASAGRHRRTARRWPAWLRRAWPQAQIWAGWSEVTCGRSRPDAICWGRLEGRETLFWLEVESGGSSTEVLQEKTLRRINRALVYARGYPVRLVFALLGMPWVREAGVKVFRDLPQDVAVVVEDWKAFGELPLPAWGRVRWS